MDYSVLLSGNANILDAAQKDVEVQLSSKLIVEDNLQYAWAYYNRVYKGYMDIAKKQLDLLVKDKKLDEFTNLMEKNSKYLQQNVKLELQVERVLTSMAGTQEKTGNPDTGLKLLLPKRELPQFSGEVRDWLSFWASFREIDNDTSLSTIDKFHYLIQSTMDGSPARKLLLSFPLSIVNYSAAVAALKERFGRNNVLVKVYVRDLLQLVISASTGKTMDFGDLVTTITSQIRNLESLGVTKDKCAQVLYPVVECCLPEDVLQAWQRNPNYQEDLSELVDFLQTEVNNYTERSLAHFDIGGGSNSGDSKNKKKTSKVGQDVQPKTITGFMNTTDNTKEAVCTFCKKGNHSPTDCRTASKWDLETRRKAIQESNACYNCFKIGHSSKKCRAKLSCVICGKNHHAFMCRSNEKGTSTEAAQSKEKSGNQKEKVVNPSENEPRVDMANLISRPEVLYQSLTIWVHGPRGSRKARAAFDSLSQASYIKEELAQKLALPLVGYEKVTHQIFGGDTTGVQKHNIHTACLSGLQNEKQYKLEIAAIPKISSPIDKLPAVGDYRAECKKLGIVLTDLETTAEDLEVIIGADFGDEFKLDGKMRRLDSGPIAIETKLGWVVSGRIKKPSVRGKVNLALLHLNAALDKEVSAHWALETIGIEDPADTKSREEMEKAAMDHFNRTVKQADDGRYTVNLPWINGHPALPDNEFLARRRLYNLTKTLRQSGQLKAYDDVLNNWVEEKIIEIPTGFMETSNCHYLPHRAVIKEGSTTPLRPVFDASAKTKNNPSLNDCLEKGPNLLSMIPGILTRFRMFQFGVTADIKKAFQQMEVNVEDRNNMRFLWWDDVPACTKIKVFRHARVVFGVSSSPFLLGATLHHLIENFPEYHNTKQLLLSSLYVDNNVSSLKTREEAERFRIEACKIMEKGKFDLRGWELGPGEENKNIAVLGLIWNMRKDTLHFDLKNLLENQDVPATKRNLYKMINMLYDPLGFAAPFIVVAKILLKRVCNDGKIGWDDQLPVDRARDFEKWKQQLGDLELVKIPRHVYAGEHNTQLSLECCVDASADCFAACVFLRVESIDQVRVSLLQCKTRVSPKKKVSIPRLELIACLVGARLVNTVRSDLKIEEIPVRYWTDSTTALSWMQRDEVWAIFVYNRVKQIRELSDVTSWRHIPGSLNPADLPSRGCSVRKMVELDWTSGPKWMYQPETSWPHATPAPDEEVIYNEIRKNIIAVNLSAPDDFEESLLRQGRYYKTLCVLAWINRFLRITRKLPNTGGKLNNEEMKAAEIVFLQYVQKGFNRSPLRKVPLIRDTDGILRLKSRLLLGEEDFEFRYPAILPGDNKLVRMLILHEHQTACHAGVQYLQASLREKYWITNSRRTIGNVVNKCSVCRRYLATRTQVEFSPLPATRINSTKVFATTGVDATGPLFVEKGVKVWVIIFTCGVYRAVHLELVNSMSTEAFLEAFRKFVARRGRPNIIYSDNGTNFTGASNLLKSVDWSEVEKYGTLQQIEWRFNPPSAAWWGGWWERLIGLMKGLLRRVLGSRLVKRHHLEVLIVEVEAIMNDRPLTYISEDPRDLRPLTPSCFLRDLPVADVPEVELTDGKTFRMNLAKIQKRKEELRERFKREYLGLLVNRSKPQQQIALTTGAVVLVETENCKRVDWPMGVILEMIEGADGNKRVARIRTTKGIITRPIQRLFLLEVPTLKQDNSAVAPTENEK